MKRKNLIYISNQIMQWIFAAVLALILLNIVSVMFSYSGSRYPNIDGYTDYHWASNRWMINIEEGGSVFKTDSNGFNNDVVNYDADVIFMGSSHVEGMQVSREKNMSYILDQLLPDSNVYNIGTSGHTIYSCVANLDDLFKMFKNVKYVIIETDQVNLLGSDIDLVISGSYPKLAANTGIIIRGIQFFAPAIMKIRKNVNLWRGSTTRSSINGINNFSEAKIQMTSNEADLCNYQYYEKFFRYVKNISTKHDCKVIFVYHPRVTINTDGNINIENEHNLDLFRTICKNNGLYFIEMGEKFIEAYSTYHIVPYGFYNTGIGKGHLNYYGHRMIAVELSKQILKME